MGDSAFETGAAPPSSPRCIRSSSDSRHKTHVATSLFFTLIIACNPHHLLTPSPPVLRHRKKNATTTTVSLKADHFEGGRFDFNKQLNQKFFLSHSIFMGSIEVPAQGNQIIKIPNATYEFGANVVDTNYMLVGRVLTDGRMSGRLKYDISDALSAKLQTSKEPGFSQVMVDLDYKGLDTQAQLKLGNGQFYGVNYLQSVSNTLSLCLLYTSPSPRDATLSRMPSSA